VGCTGTQGPFDNGVQRVLEQVGLPSRSGWVCFTDPAHEGELKFLFPKSNFHSTHKQKEIWEKYLETLEIMNFF
jgi:hypothetical protein